MINKNFHEAYEMIKTYKVFSNVSEIERNRFSAEISFFDNQEIVFSIYGSKKFKFYIFDYKAEALHIHYAYLRNFLNSIKRYVEYAPFCTDYLKIFDVESEHKLSMTSIDVSFLFKFKLEDNSFDYYNTGRMSTNNIFNIKLPEFQLKEDLKTICEVREVMFDEKIFKDIQDGKSVEQLKKENRGKINASNLGLL